MYEQADACLHVLGGEAAKELEAALSDPRNFGMAKSIMMAGHAAGFDIGTKAGVEAWMRTVQVGSLPASELLSPLNTPLRRLDPVAHAKKKKQRKARKKNR